MKLQYKLSVLYVSLILFLGIAMVFFNSKILTESLTKNLLSREEIGLSLLENRIFPYLADGDYASVTSILFEERSVKKDIVDYITVHDANGRLVAHTFLDDIPSELLSHQKTVAAAQDPHIANARAAKDILVTQEIRDGDYKAGYVYIAYKKAYIDNTVSKIAGLLSVTVFVVVLFAALLSVLFSKVFIQPIKELVSGMDEVSKGNLDAKLNIKTGDELELLAESFNKMTDDLKKSGEQIRVYAKEMELNVLKRTKEVEQSRKELQAKVEELERFNKLAVGRELKMVELKKKMAELEDKKR